MKRGLVRRNVCLLEVVKGKKVYLKVFKSILRFLCQVIMSFVINECEVFSFSFSSCALSVKKKFSKFRCVVLLCL